MSIRESRLRISVIDGVSGRLGRMQGAISQFHRRNTALLSPLRGTFGRIAAFGGAYLGITRGVEGTIGAAREMQAVLTEIGIKADLTGGEIERLRQQMTGLSPRVNQTTSELLAGVDAMVTLGLSADQAVAAMPAIGQTATATMSSIADLSAASVAAMQNFKVAPGEIAKMLDAMAEAGNQGAFEMRDMARHFPALTASASSLGMEGVDSITDMAAALQIARRGAGDAGTAANNMANFLQKIMSPEVAKRFKKFGVNTTKELQRAHKLGVSPIEHFIKLVDQKTKGGRADLLGQLFGDKQVLEFVRPMLADFEDYLRIRGDAERASGTVADAYGRRMEDAEQKIKAFRIQVENLGQSLGATALAPLGDFAGRLAHILDTLDRRVGVFDKIRAAFDGFAAGFGQKDAASMLRNVGTWMEEGIFGKEFDGGDFRHAVDERVNEIARISNRFREIGRNFRQFAEDVANNPIGRFVGQMSGYGFQLMIAATGISLLAGAVGKLARAMWILSGAGAAVGIIKMMAGVGGAIFKRMPKLPKAAAPAAKMPSAAPAGTGPQAMGSRAGRSATPGINAKPSKGFKSPWSPAAESIGGRARYQGPAAFRPKAPPPVPAPMMELPSVAPKPMGWGAAMKNLFGKGGLISTGLLAVGEAGISTGLEAMNSRLYTPEQREKAREAIGVRRGRTIFGNEVDVLPSTFENLRRLDKSLTELFPSMKANVPGKGEFAPQTTAPMARPAPVQPTGVFDQFLKGMDRLAPQGGAQVDALREKVEAATKGWPQAAAEGIQGYVDAIAKGGATAVNDASRIGAQIEDALSVVGHPSVETGDLSRALDLARQLGMAVRQLGAAKIGAAVPKVDGARAKGGDVRSGGTYLVGEEGPELVTFGQKGFVHTAARTAKMMRNAALASAPGAMPAAAAAPQMKLAMPHMPETPAMRIAAPKLPAMPQMRLAAPQMPALPSMAMTVPEMPDAPAMRIAAPDIPDLSIPSAPAARAGNQRSERSVVINFARESIVIKAAPGQSEEHLFQAFERRLSRELNSLSQRAFSDGAN